MKYLLRKLKNFAAPLLFRRVSPAETKHYAFVRNTFALLAILILLVRSVTALLQADNKFDTRLLSRQCSINVNDQYPQMLMIDRSRTNQNPNETLTFSTSIITDTNRTIPAEGCTQTNTLVQNHTEPGRAEPSFTRFSLFSCQPRFYSMQLWYNIAARSSSGTSLPYYPYIWMLNRNDSTEFAYPSISSTMDSGAPSYVTAWGLRPGYHLEVEARLVRRRFITSSLLRDLIINLEPQYKEISLYPTTVTSVTALTNSSIATARLRVTTWPSFNFVGSKYKAWDQSSGIVAPMMCDTIEDYRTNTILDVIGSIGGLFALLQAAHVLLFGRPLLWGLTGAKLITPFGLLGACSSRGFRRRLREQYHRQPTSDNPDTIQVGAFLHDFVIDFGPAEGDLRGSKEQQDTSGHGSISGSKRADHAGIEV